MIDAFVEWATYRVPTPVGVLLLLLIYHSNALRRMATRTARAAGVLPEEGGSS